jgi:cyclophilin family peptidyl-prolyl cis-trans isomerase
MKRLVIILAAILCFNLISQGQEKETRVVIHTNYGDIKVKLYNDTPIHRDNFIELVKNGWYDGSNFHRVINQFMIQGGSGKNGAPDPGYTLPAEFRPNHIHKKGALAAARKPDQVNPNKESSGSQFYIVQGQVFNEGQLNQMSGRTGIVYTDEQKKLYETIGGTPHLDGSYTVFGEVVDGLEVVDAIAAVNTTKGNKPVEPVTMTMEITE